VLSNVAHAPSVSWHARARSPAACTPLRGRLAEKRSIVPRTGLSSPGPGTPAAAAAREEAAR